MFFLILILLFNCVNEIKTNYGTITIINNSNKNILYKGEYIDDYYGEWETDVVIVPDAMWKYRFEKTVLDKIKTDLTTDIFIKSMYSFQGHKYVLKNDVTEQERDEIKEILKKINYKTPRWVINVILPADKGYLRPNESANWELIWNNNGTPFNDADETRDVQTKDSGHKTFTIKNKMLKGFLCWGGYTGDNSNDNVYENYSDLFYLSDNSNIRIVIDNSSDSSSDIIYY